MELLTYRSVLLPNIRLYVLTYDQSVVPVCSQKSITDTHIAFHIGYLVYTFNIQKYKLLCNNILLIIYISYFLFGLL